MATTKQKPASRDGRTSERRRAHGGVSPQPNAPAILGTETMIEPRVAPTPAAAAFPHFTYHGGPVITCAWIYTSFWGSQWLTDPAHVTRAGRLCQFHADVLQSGFMNVLSQYGAGFGAGAGGAFIQASFVTGVPATLDETNIHATIQSCINADVFPEPPSPSNNALIVYLDDAHAVDDPGAGLVLCEPTHDTAFGYHSFFDTAAGHPFYYAIIPSLTDGCLHNSCSSDAGCSLHLSEPQEARLTQVASHEFAEMVTDPELNAWFDSSGGENGDICNGESDVITVSGRTWTVQRTYSKSDDLATNGATYCLATAPTPRPRLSPGPAARPAILARVQKMAPMERVLPLPPVRFDAKAKKLSRNDAELRTYAEKLFYPLKPHTLVGDFPGFLRYAADVLAKKE